jgi:hypothetical protein
MLFIDDLLGSTVLFSRIPLYALACVIIASFAS